MPSECESELNIDEEMSNVCVHISQNLNWIWSQKGQIVSNAENETGESSAAQTLLSKTFQHNEDAMSSYLIFEGNLNVIPQLFSKCSRY